ncbi:hypothetical protein ACFLSS_00455 [Bacteroidota bacterium]
MESSSEKSAIDEILSHLRNIDKRVSKIEENLDIYSELEEVEKQDVPDKEDSEQREKRLEERIGQVWFPRLGILGFAIGFVFFITLPLEGLPVFLPALIGYLIAAGLFSAAKFWDVTFSHLSGYLISAGFVLLFLASMRLYFFSPEKTIDSFPVIIALLMIVTIVTLLTSVRRKSINFASLGITLGSATAIIIDSPYLIFIISVALAVTIVFLKLKFEWNGLLFYGMFITYFTHLAWFINNPFIGHSIETQANPQLNLLFILLYAIIFSAAYLFSDKKEDEDLISAGGSMFNCGMGYGLFLLISFLKLPELFFAYHIAAAVMFLAIAITYWVKWENKYSTFFYAIFGYIALSVAIIAKFEQSDYFIWMSWQSLLVVSTAVWFRSKFIIVANFIIYLMIFFAYLFVEQSSGGISLSFGLVALISARILNWQKDRLELTTEQMRNAYLLSALFIIPYSFYQMFPAGFVSLTWIALAIIYYMLSIMLNNKKYRWMALATYILTVIYVFILGFAGTDTTMTIISFVVLGATLIFVSISYARKKVKTKSE